MLLQNMYFYNDIQYKNWLQGNLLHFEKYIDLVKFGALFTAIRQVRSPILLCKTSLNHQ